MSTYAVTGSASGMGRAAAERLRTDGHRVIGIDLRDAEVIADLSTAQGRSDAAAEVLALAEGRLDGAVMAAGVGPLPDRNAV
ncbi:NAD-dependent epimerase, partial [Mycolicibacterium fortuitum]